MGDADVSAGPLSRTLGGLLDEMAALMVEDRPDLLLLQEVPVWAGAVLGEATGMGVTLDEDTLEITEIARHGTTEPYRALSIGTREQLSILVRLAFAVYLREKGYPAAVILDDALVYADDDRF